MPDPSYQFSVSEFTTNTWTFEQDVESYARLGVDAIEVCEFKLDSQGMDEQLALVDRHGLVISSVQPEIRTLFPSRSQPEPTQVSDRMARFRETINCFARRASGVPFITNTGIPPNGNVQEVFDTAVREYHALADFAAERGALIALEPLNASIMNVESSIWTVDQAMQIVDAVDRRNFGICLDLWNVWQNARIEDAIRAAGDRIFIVQVSDWRTPRSYEDRLIVGDGDIPFPPLIRAIYDAGYRGPYELEIFSDEVPDSLWAGDLEHVIQRSREGLELAWKRAFS
jgi:sugar phosphate isomerase/epimerase